MKRGWIILVAAVLIELTRGYFTPTLQALPLAPAGWTRVTQTALDPIPHDWPETSHAIKAWRATYTGTSLVTLTLYAMPWSPGSSWDAIQRWRPVPGAMAFSKGRYFGIAVSQASDQAALKRFFGGVAATLPRGAVSIR
ncbi:MAG TPA: hypothetical protein VFW44_21585 [Bryobacteraceae bacterium]|nr:hypothetical protein [Bryobacteraceae bacterium]